MTLQQLTDLVDWLNNGKETFQLSQADQDYYTEQVRLSLNRQFSDYSASSTLRVSSLGKPAVLQALQVLGYGGTFIPSNRNRTTFHIGDVLEAYLFTLCKLYGFEVGSEQLELEYMGVKGHIDGIINGDILIECKTMSDYYHRKFAKEQDDSRGYATQLSIYSEVLGLPAYWLCFNKGQGTWSLHELQSETRHRALKRAERVIPRLREVTKLEDVLTVFKAPPPVPELRYGKPTGNYVPDDSIKYSEFLECFYETYTESKGSYDKTYILEVRDYDDAISRLREMLSEEAQLLTNAFRDAV